VTFLIFALLSGIFFGVYCQVFVLIPATLAMAATYSVVAMLDSGSGFSSASLIIVPSVGLQGGYMIGLTSRNFLVPFKARGNGPESKRI
jgi:hypothetical protein